MAAPVARAHLEKDHLAPPPRRRCSSARREEPAAEPAPRASGRDGEVVDVQLVRRRLDDAVAEDAALGVRAAQGARATSTSPRSPRRIASRNAAHAPRVRVAPPLERGQRVHVVGRAASSDERRRGHGPLGPDVRRAQVEGPQRARRDPLPRRQPRLGEAARGGPAR